MRYYNIYFCSVVNFNNRKQNKIYFFAQKWHGGKQATLASFYSRKSKQLHFWPNSIGTNFQGIKS